MCDQRPTFPEEIPDPDLWQHAVPPAWCYRRQASQPRGVIYRHLCECNSPISCLRISFTDSRSPNEYGMIAMSSLARSDFGGQRLAIEGRQPRPGVVRPPRATSSRQGCRRLQQRSRSPEIRLPHLGQRVHRHSSNFMTFSVVISPSAPTSSCPLCGKVKSIY